MYIEQARVVSEMGIHAKAASEIIKASTQFKSNIFLEYEGRLINAKSIVGLLAAAIPEGSVVKVSANGPDEMDAVKRLVTIIEEE